jgi:type IV secretion system protein TrbE
MLSLREYRNKADRLADFLPWAALVAPGVVLNKDGSFQRSARFRGPDLDSATPAELIATTARLNSALRRLGSGWAIFVEAVRRPAQDYPDSDFPDPASALVERERAAQFAEEGAHFESGYYLTLLWMPPAEDAALAESWLYEGKAEKGVNPKELLDLFIDRTERLLRLVEGFVPEVAWLDDSETLTYLHSCISTRSHRVRVPETPMHLDALLADEPLTGGLEPRLGRAHLRTLTARRTQPARLRLPLVNPRGDARQNRCDQADGQDPAAMVRQAQVGRGDPQGGYDQRGVDAAGQRCLEQGRRC